MPEVDEDDPTCVIYTNKEHAKHTLYCGTTVLQTRFYGGRPVQVKILWSCASIFRC